MPPKGDKSRHATRGNFVAAQDSYVNHSIKEEDRKDAVLVNVRGDGNCLPRALAVAHWDFSDGRSAAEVSDTYAEVRQIMGTHSALLAVTGNDYCHSFMFQ